MIESELNRREEKNFRERFVGRKERSSLSMAHFLRSIETFDVLDSNYSIEEIKAFITSNIFVEQISIELTVEILNHNKLNRRISSIIAEKFSSF